MKTYLKLKRRLIWILSVPKILFNKYVIAPRQFKEIKKILESEHRSISSTNISELFFLASSFRINSEDRLRILETTLKETLKYISSLKLKVADASETGYSAKAREILNLHKEISLEYSNKKEGLNTSYYSLLSSSDEPYFGMAFDDLPIIGMTEEFIAATCQLLNDFQGLVDMLYIEDVMYENIDDNNRKVYYRHSSRNIMKNKDCIVGVVKYGKYKFAIVKNFYYGFFFNTIIAQNKDFTRRLFWYMKNIDRDSPHQIELASSLMIGPIYNYIALPLEVINMDMDYSHTDISIRKPLDKAVKLYHALKNNYEVEALDKINI